jgi:hypothetical protein
VQRYDYEDLPDEPVRPKPKEAVAESVPTRSFQHEIEDPVQRRSKAAQTPPPNMPTTVLTDDQLKQCGDAYINNGMVRGVVDRTIFFVQGDRTKFVIDPNDELTDSITDEEEKKLQQDIAEDKLQIKQEVNEETGDMVIKGQQARIKDLRRKGIRLNKRVRLHINIERLLNSALVFGRGALEIVRMPKSEEWPRYGEPLGLRHIPTRSITDVVFNKQTGRFEGLYYNTGLPERPVKFVKAESAIVAIHDDHNLYENTQGSGLSAVWPILSVSQSDDVINDEDIPEIVRNTGGVLTLIYAGTNNEEKLKELTKKISGKTQTVHGLDGLQLQSVALGRKPTDITEVRVANGKYICQCMSLPLFLMFEDTANFATANQTMQVYKEGVLKRYRAWLQGILEDFWYDTILADHLDIDVKDVILAPIRMKATFDDISFETRETTVETDERLFQMEVFNRQDVAKDIDRKDVAHRIDEEESKMDVEKQKAVGEVLSDIQKMQAEERKRQMIAQVPKRAGVSVPQPSTLLPKRNASAAAAIITSADYKDSQSAEHVKPRKKKQKG